MQGKVEIAGVNTAKLKVLKSSETMELLRRSKAGDRQAREELIEGNLRLVLSVIQRFAGRGESVDDLFQVGCVGLIKAIDNFDISQPVKFSTYGVPMIVGEIRRYLRDNSAIRVSRSMRDTAYRVLQAREHLMAENQKEPTVEEIAKVLDIPREEVVFAMDAIVDPVSLYEPIYDSGGDAICVMDQVSDTKNTDERWTERIALKDAMKLLDPRERRILSLRFYEGKTQMEVSAEVGISQAQVSRLEKGAPAVNSEFHRAVASETKRFLSIFFCFRLTFSVKACKMGQNHVEEFLQMDMQKILEYRNARNRFCQRVGITVTELSPGYAKVVKTVTEDDLNPVDVAHGGLFFSMADNAAGSAMAAYGEQAVTLNAQYNFMRAAKAGDVLTAEAREAKHGLRIRHPDHRSGRKSGWHRHLHLLQPEKAPED